MSTLWTPGGERPIRREPQPPAGGTSGGPGGPPGGGSPRGPGGVAGPPDSDIPPEEMARQVEQLREQLAQTPVSVVVANHAFGLFELAALHLSLQPPQLDEARLAIDALGYLVEGLGERLGDPAGELGSALSQLRMAFVQISKAHQSPGAEPPPA